MKEKSDDHKFTVMAWIFCLVFALHELEEWNILTWHQQHHENFPPLTNLDIRTFLIFITIVFAAWTSISLIPKKTKIRAYLFLPAVALAVSNGVMHIFWLFSYGAYAPGVIFGGIAGVPLGAYIAWFSINKQLLPIWYVIVLGSLVVLSVFSAVRAGGNLDPQLLGLLGIAGEVARFLWN